LASIGDLCGHHCRYHHEAVAHGAIALFGIAATALTGTLSINQALSGFGNSTIWLIVVAFFISRGFIKTGLGVGLSTYSWRRSAKRPWA
jgi:DASS family divalent anion:Na+ symporter